MQLKKDSQRQIDRQRYLENDILLKERHGIKNRQRNYTEKKRQQIDKEIYLINTLLRKRDIEGQTETEADRKESKKFRQRRIIRQKQREICIQKGRQRKTCRERRVNLERQIEKDRQRKIERE